MYDKSIQVTIHIKVTKENEAESTFLKNENFVFGNLIHLWEPKSNKILNTFDSDFNCTTRKSTVSYHNIFATGDAFRLIK